MVDDARASHDAGWSASEWLEMIRTDAGLVDIYDDRETLGREAHAVASLVWVWGRGRRRFV